MAVAVEAPGVTRDATLDSFLDGDAEPEGEADDDEAGQEPAVERAETEQQQAVGDEEGEHATTETEHEPGDPESVAPTADWHPEGRECEACGAVVERRWHQDDAMVCPACKDWQVA